MCAFVAPSFVCPLLLQFSPLILLPLSLFLPLSLSPSLLQPNTLSPSPLCPVHHSHGLCIQRIQMFPPFLFYLPLFLTPCCFYPLFVIELLFFFTILILFFSPLSLPAAKPYAVWGGGGVGRAGWLDRWKRRRENCAGRKDVLVAAASDSISMNFTAKAAAAASSDCSRQPAAAGLCVGASSEGPVAGSHPILTLEGSLCRTK